MRINWKVRLQNKAFWVAAIPAVLLLVQAVLGLLGIDWQPAALNDALLELEKGDTVAITYFTGNGYTCTHTTIVEVDPIYRRLRTEDGIIRFKDLWDVVCE